MSEPMDDSLHNSEPVICSESRTKPVSVLRPGSMVTMTITPEDYAGEYWPRLEGAINQLLTLSPGEYIPISYEQMYSCVYKCVCKQFSERLYMDLLRHVSEHLERVCQDLLIVQQENPGNIYVEQFSYAVTQYLQALTGIVPIFNYMNRFYLESKLKTDLNTELRKLFTNIVVEKHIGVLLSMLREVEAMPFAVSPPVMSSLIKDLYALNPELSHLNLQLFAKYIPGVLPASTEADLERYIAETKQMQQELIQNFEFNRGSNSRKRPTEEDLPRGTPVSFMP